MQAGIFYKFLSVCTVKGEKTEPGSEDPISAPKPGEAQPKTTAESAGREKTTDAVAAVTQPAKKDCLQGGL